jgi:hypothetical protein
MTHESGYFSFKLHKSVMKVKLQEVLAATISAEVFPPRDTKGLKI